MKTLIFVLFATGLFGQTQINFLDSLCVGDSAKVFTTVEPDIPSDHTIKTAYLYRSDLNSFNWFESERDTVEFYLPTNYFEVIKVTTAFNYQGSQYIIYSNNLVGSPTNCTSSVSSIVIEDVVLCYVLPNGIVTGIKPNHGFYYEIYKNKVLKKFRP